MYRIDYDNGAGHFAWQKTDGSLFISTINLVHLSLSRNQMGISKTRTPAGCLLKDAVRIDQDKILNPEY